MFGKFSIWSGFHEKLLFLRNIALSKKIEDFHLEKPSEAFRAVEDRRKKQETKKDERVSQVYESFWREPG